MQCDTNVSYNNREECHLYPETLGNLDSVAGVRIVVTMLGILGSCSIIILSLIKKRVFNPQIHPIFMLSVADCLLGIFWIAGGALWLTPPKSYDDKLCYVITVCTVILECITINLTLVYAIFAFIATKRTDLNTLFARTNKMVGWRFTALVYSIAWLFPVFMVSLVFVSITESEKILSNINTCTCWCIPTVVNIIPYALSGRDPDADNDGLREYIVRQKKLIYGLGSLTIINYIIAFIGLSVLYFKVLRKIKSIRQQHDEIVYGRSSNYQYGTTEYSRIVNSQSRARKRVVIFLTVFLVSGLCNIVVTSSLIGLIQDIPPSDPDRGSHKFHKTRFTTFISILLVQSIIMGLQGFVNAIAYGWTRDDFVQTLSSPDFIDEDKILGNNNEQDCDSTSGELKNEIEIAIGQASAASRADKSEFLETIYPSSDQEDDSSFSDY